MKIEQRKARALNVLTTIFSVKISTQTHKHSHSFAFTNNNGFSRSFVRSFVAWFFTIPFIQNSFVSVLFDVFDKNDLISFTRFVYLVEYLLSYGNFLLFCYLFEHRYGSTCFFRLHWYSSPVHGDRSSHRHFHRVIYVTKLICFCFSLAVVK